MTASDLAWYATAAMAFVATVTWAGSASDRWELFAPKERAISVSVGSLLAALCYGTIEAAQVGSPVGLRVLLVFASMAALFLSLTWPPSRLVRRRRR